MASMRSKSQIITEGETLMIKNGMRPIHPGEILFEEFMKPSERPINTHMLTQSHQCGGEPDHGDYQRPTWYHRGYCRTLGNILRHHG